MTQTPSGPAASAARSRKDPVQLLVGAVGTLPQADRDLVYAWLLRRLPDPVADEVTQPGGPRPIPMAALLRSAMTVTLSGSRPAVPAVVRPADGAGPLLVRAARPVAGMVRRARLLDGDRGARPGGPFPWKASFPRPASRREHRPGRIVKTHSPRCGCYARIVTPYPQNETSPWPRPDRQPSLAAWKTHSPLAAPPPVHPAGPVCPASPVCPGCGSVPPPTSSPSCPTCSASIRPGAWWSSARAGRASGSSLASAMTCPIRPEAARGGGNRRARGRCAHPRGSPP